VFYVLCSIIKVIQNTQRSDADIPTCTKDKIEKVESQVSIKIHTGYPDFQFDLRVGLEGIVWKFDGLEVWTVLCTHYIRVLHVQVYVGNTQCVSDPANKSEIFYFKVHTDNNFKS